MFFKKAFTLVELLVVVLILGALAFIAVPRILNSAEDAKEKACSSNIDIINSQIEMFYAETGDLPETITDVTENTTYFPDGPPECPLGGTYSLNANKHAVCSHSGGGGCGG